jgi:2'-5' RNA ligase
LYYALSLDPQLNAELSDSIDAIRNEYDPTVAVVKPHITVIFPVPERVGEARLIRHVENVLRDWSPFEIQLGGLHKSRDHWLFLTLKAGAEQVRNLYRALYTGILAEFRGNDSAFVPHIGLGLFLKKGATYVWNNPQESDFNQERYERALAKARALPVSPTITVTKLHLMKIPDDIIEWTTGKRASIPVDSRIVEVRGFYLQNHGV